MFSSFSLMSRRAWKLALQLRTTTTSAAAATSRRCAAAVATAFPRTRSIYFHTTTCNNKQQEQSDKIETLFQKILWLDMIEVHLLTELLQEKMQLSGIVRATDDATTSMSMSSTQKEEEVKTTFDLKLMSFDTKNKIKIIKEVRAAIPGLGLKEAKELVEGAPTILKKDIKREEAEELQQKLQDVGATMDIV